MFIPEMIHIADGKKENLPFFLLKRSGGNY